MADPRFWHGRVGLELGRKPAVALFDNAEEAGVAALVNEVARRVPSLKSSLADNQARSSSKTNAASDASDSTSSKSGASLKSSAATYADKASGVSGARQSRVQFDRREISEVINTLRRHRGEPDVIEDACETLRQLTAQDARTRSSALSLGVVTLTLELMRNHPSHVGVQIKASTVIPHFSLGLGLWSTSKRFIGG